MTGNAHFDDWIRPHMGALMRIARAFAEPADQHDLMQELMISAWKAMPAFRGDAKPSTFIYRVAHNRALTWKKRQSLNLFRAHAAQTDMAALNDGGTDGESARLEALYAALRQLSPIDRSLMLLWLEETSYADMAALHGLTETNIGARLTRARARLSALIHEVSDEH
ncbi:sigma-70 family RNA polymerase sigma factor [Asticcacaulis sp. SL142]|uniref:RNA polymerase sigma factor n=1 Tax=Asticcacaulis sp. SL142 TaxID=2995155 RepID=UPI00226CCBEE|nr:sigma-70 family RNA polymerase sigma factor [Asticcacaulis sp. SL142]WAC48439.1 sigma-70 family RNA polymerase sigma factor [Asticcacaulis sp. SL142]